MPLSVKFSSFSISAMSLLCEIPFMDAVKNIRLTHPEAYAAICKNMTAIALKNGFRLAIPVLNPVLNKDQKPVLTIWPFSTSSSDSHKYYLMSILSKQQTLDQYAAQLCTGHRYLGTYNSSTMNACQLSATQLVAQFDNPVATNVIDVCNHTLFENTYRPAQRIVPVPPPAVRLGDPIMPPPVESAHARCKRGRPSMQSKPLAEEASSPTKRVRAESPNPTEPPTTPPIIEDVHALAKQARPLVEEEHESSVVYVS